MYLTPSGPTRSARPGRPLTGLRGLGGAPGGGFMPIAPTGVLFTPNPLAPVNPSLIIPSTNPLPQAATPSTSAPPASAANPPYIYQDPYSMTPYSYTPSAVLPTSGRIITAPIVVGPVQPLGSAPTNASTAGTPVPANYPTNQIYVDPATGTFYEYSATQNAWMNVGVPYNTGQPPGASSGNTYAGTPVPSTQPTNAPYRDSSGNYWVFNGQAWTNAGASGYFPGTSIPISTPTNELYTDTYGNQWTYSNGNWQLVSSPSSTTSAFTADGVPASSAALTAAPPAVAESGTQSLLDWFSETTLISGVANWVLAAGAGIVALKLMKGGKR